MSTRLAREALSAVQPSRGDVDHNILGAREQSGYPTFGMLLPLVTQLLTLVANSRLRCFV